MAALRPFKKATWGKKDSKKKKLRTNKKFDKKATGKIEKKEKEVERKWWQEIKTREWNEKLSSYSPLLYFSYSIFLKIDVALPRVAVHSVSK